MKKIHSKIMRDCIVKRNPNIVFIYERIHYILYECSKIVGQSEGFTE